MFSPRCSDTRVDGLLQMLPDVVSDVTEQMFFGWAEQCEPHDLAAAATGSSGCAALPAWLQSSVTFDGMLHGSLTLTLPCDLAFDLASAMLGGEDVTPELLGDVAAELANMVCGAMLTRVETIRPFSLHPPSIQWDPAPRIAGGHCLHFSVNERPMVVSLNAVAA